MNIPDYPPLPEPGDLVLAVYQDPKYGLSEADWAAFDNRRKAIVAQWKTMLGHAKRGVGIAPGWYRDPTEILRAEAHRLKELGRPEWRLMDAWVRERELREE